jgi:hypothetical protein
MMSNYGFLGVPGETFEQTGEFRGHITEFI